MSAPEAIADRRVHPATIPLRFVKDAPRTVLGLPAAFAFISDKGLWTVVAFAAAIAAAAIGWQALVWHRFRYGIGERGMVIESGVLHRTRRLIPFERVQDVDVERGPIARLFGLAKLKIETGGGGNDEGVLDSVRVDEAERIRVALRRGRVLAETPQEADVVQPEPIASVLFDMPLQRVLLTGLFNFSMVYLALVGAVFQMFEPFIGFDFRDVAGWLGLIDDNVRGGRAAVITVAVLVLLLLGVITGVLTTLSRDFGFRLTREGEGLRRVRGLLTRSDVLIPRRRIQLAVLTTGPFKQRFGWAELGVQTLGTTEKKGQPSRQSVAPLARAQEVDEILSALRPMRVAQAGELQRVSSRHWLRRFIVEAWVPLSAIAIGAWFTPLALLGLVLLPFFAIDGLVARRFKLYGRTDDLLFVQSGVLKRRQWIIPTGNIQVLRLTRTWLQRRLGLSSVTFDTAGGSRMQPPRIIDMRDEDARALLASLRGK